MYLHYIHIHVKGLDTVFIITACITKKLVSLVEYQLYLYRYKAIKYIWVQGIFVECKIALSNYFYNHYLITYILCVYVLFFVLVINFWSRINILNEFY